MPNPRLNRKGFVALRNSDGVKADLKARAERVAANLGEGHEVNVTESRKGRGRARARVITSTTKAKRNASRNPGDYAAALEAGRG